MKKGIAVLFPGIGYTNDRPLLYYSKKIVKEIGFDCVEINYSISEKIMEIKNNTDKMKECFQSAMQQTERKLSDINFQDYERVVFIAKSIGTVIAACYDSSNKIDAENVILTPLPQTFDYLKNNSGIIFHGSTDPWCETNIVEKASDDLDIKLFKIENANHSLETGNIITDIENLEKIIKEIRKFVLRLEIK